MFNKQDWQIIVSEFVSYLMLHTSDLVPQLS